MEVTQLFIYPIKSLRGTAVDRATVTKQGFLFDRCFVLLQESKDGKTKYKHMAVAHVPEMALFTTSIRFPDAEQEGVFTVTFSPPDGKSQDITIPLQPDIAGLELLNVNMHGSPASAFDMGEKYNAFFTATFGYPVKLAAIGENQRQVLFPKSANQQALTSSWLSNITKNIPFIRSSTEEDEKIKFQDCAPFLVVTEKSSQDVTERLPAGDEMDIRKFRPNIVVSGESAWDEDFWAEIAINKGEDEIKIPLQHNCIRCVSLNVDFKTGKFETANERQALKLLQRDRRVDKLKKYSPVFGRYGFLEQEGVGKEIKVGDWVSVTKRNEQRTGFDWPGI